MDLQQKLNASEQREAKLQSQIDEVYSGLWLCRHSARMCVWACIP